MLHKAPWKRRQELHGQRHREPQQSLEGRIEIVYTGNRGISIHAVRVSFRRLKCHIIALRQRHLRRKRRISVQHDITIDTGQKDSGRNSGTQPPPGAPCHKRRQAHKHEKQQGRTHQSGQKGSRKESTSRQKRNTHCGRTPEFKHRTQ